MIVSRIFGLEDDMFGIPAELLVREIIGVTAGLLVCGVVIARVIILCHCFWGTSPHKPLNNQSTK